MRKREREKEREREREKKRERFPAAHKVTKTWATVTRRDKSDRAPMSMRQRVIGASHCTYLPFNLIQQTGLFAYLERGRAPCVVYLDGIICDVI